MRSFLLAAAMVAGLVTVAHADARQQQSDWHVLSFSTGHCDRYASGPNDLNQVFRKAGMTPAMHVYRDTGGRVVSVTLYIKGRPEHPDDAIIYFFPSAAGCAAFRRYEIEQGEILNDDETNLGENQ